MDGLRRPSRRDVSADPRLGREAQEAALASCVALAPPSLESTAGNRGALMYLDVLNAAIAGCKRAALWYLFVAVDKKVLGAVVEGWDRSTTA